MYLYFVLSGRVVSKKTQYLLWPCKICNRYSAKTGTRISSTQSNKSSHWHFHWWWEYQFQNGQIWTIIENCVHTNKHIFLQREKQLYLISVKRYKIFSKLQKIDLGIFHPFCKGWDDSSWLGFLLRLSGFNKRRKSMSDQ